MKDKNKIKFIIHNSDNTLILNNIREFDGVSITK